MREFHAWERDSHASTNAGQLARSDTPPKNTSAASLSIEPDDFACHRPMVGTSRCDVPARVSAGGTNHACGANHATRCAATSRRGRRSAPSLPPDGIRSESSRTETVSAGPVARRGEREQIGSFQAALLCGRVLTGPAHRAVGPERFSNQSESHSSGEIFRVRIVSTCRNSSFSCGTEYSALVGTVWRYWRKTRNSCRVPRYGPAKPEYGACG